MERGLEFRIDIAPDVPKALIDDPVRLSQVINNLASNAIRFSDAGDELHIEVRQAGDGPATADTSILTFTVRVTGIGMGPTELERLFKPFSQADNSTTRKYGGTGLGLIISRDLIERMGGRIEVQSTSGVGMNDHIGKPVKPALMFTTMAKWIGRPS